MERMTPEQFCYWFKGFLEIGKGGNLTDLHWNRIKGKLDEVLGLTTIASFSGYATTANAVPQSYDRGFAPCEDQNCTLCYPRP